MSPYRNLEAIENPSPLVLIVSLEGFQLTKDYSVPSTIDKAVHFRGEEYKLFAVTYGNGGHFIVRFFGLEDNVMEYDGLQRLGKFVAVKRTLYMHQTAIQTSQNVSTYADKIFYAKQI